MSLFDVLKYGSIDLTNSEELLKLPPDIFMEYRMAAYKHFSSHMSYISKEMAAQGMARAWLNLGAHSEEDLRLKWTLFKRVLEEYEPV